MTSKVENIGKKKEHSFIFLVQLSQNGNAQDCGISKAEDTCCFQKCIKWRYREVNIGFRLDLANIGFRCAFMHYLNGAFLSFQM